MSEDKKKSKWKLLRGYFAEQFNKPFKHPEFIFYFFLIIIGFGMIGVWTTLYVELNAETINDKNIALSIIGYAVPLIATGAVDLIFTREKIIQNAIKMIGISTVPIGILLLILCFNMNTSAAYFWSIFGVVLSWLIWWIVNADNSNIIESDLADQMSKETKKLGDSLTDLEH